MDLQDIVGFAVVLLAFLIKALVSAKKRGTPSPGTKAKPATPVKKSKEVIKPPTVYKKTSAVRKPLSLPQAQSAHVARRKAPFFKDKNELKKGFIFQEILKKHPESF